MAGIIHNETFVEFDLAAFRYPPTWTRLEPQSKSGDPRPGIEARVHDPLWLLGRQWQLGEFEGEDAGTPLTVRVVTNTVPVDRWGARDLADGQWLGPHDLLEPLVEAELPSADRLGPGLRPRAEAGAALLAAIDDAGLAGGAGYRQALIDNVGLVLEPLAHPGGAQAALDPEWVRLVRLIGGRPMVDGESACARFEEAGGGLPAWLVPDNAADEAALIETFTGWARWYRTEVSPLADRPVSWVGERLEYRFQVGAGDTVLAAPAHGGGEIGWHSFDATPTGVLNEPAEARDEEAPNPDRQVHALLASPLRYPGMPSDRLWELEDASVNLGLIEAEPWDLARLLVAEFALTYGNDWLVVPVDVPYGSLVTVESVMYVTTFGERFRVQATEQVSPDGHWQLYRMTEAPRWDEASKAYVDGPAIPGLLIPPGAVAVQDGSAYEEVLFLRDEMANLCWAVERSVQGPSGAGRDRSREKTAPLPGVGPVTTAALDYLLQTVVPERWIPYLPKSSGYRSIELVQGAMPDPDKVPIPPVGRLLLTGDVGTIKDAEIPREGVVVRRVPSMTRRADGSYVRWTTRRVSVGRGEGSSQLAFDWGKPRKPTPNG